MFCDSGFAGKLARMFACLLLPILFSSMAWADTTRVFVEAPAQRVFLPYGLGQAVPLADSGFHRLPGCVLAPEFETACRTFGAFDISRAFALASDADTIRYNPSGEPINVSFMRNWYVVRVPDTISVDAMVSVLKDSLGLWAEPPIGAWSPDGKYLAYTDAYNGAIYVWDVAADTTVQVSPGIRVFNPDWDSTGFPKLGDDASILHEGSEA